MLSLKKRIIIYCILAVVIFVYLFPIYWTITTSFKTRQQAEMSAVPVLFPNPITFDNYRQLLTGDFFKYFSNSMVVSTSNVLLCLILGIPAGYALARSKFKRRNDIAFWILSLRFAPPYGAIIPFYLIFTGLGLIDTPFALILMYILFNLPFTIWMMKGFVQDLPADLEEAALVDGCSRSSALWRVVFPLIRPGIAATAILCFIFAWNEFLFAFILTRTAARTIPVAIAAYVGYLSIEWGRMCAASTVAFAPIIVFFLLVQKHLIRGLTLGAVKG